MFMLNVVVLSVHLLFAFMQIVIMLNVCNAEYHYAKCCNSYCHYAKCCNAYCQYAEC